MGAKLAKPNNPADNVAKAEADLALQGMEASVKNFFSDVRLGNSTTETLGYPVTDQKLISQEYHLVVQTATNAPSDQINQAIDALFSQDWKAVAKLAVGALATFFGGDTPKPTDSAMNDVFSKSYLLFENNNIVQYSIYIKRTNAKSIGTLIQNSQSTMMAAICKANVDYKGIDPQTVIGSIQAANSDKPLTNQQVKDILSAIKEQLQIAAQLAKLKKQLEAGIIPSGTDSVRLFSRQPVVPAETTNTIPSKEEIMTEVADSTSQIDVENKTNLGIRFNGTPIAPNSTTKVTLADSGYCVVAYQNLKSENKELVIQLPFEKRFHLFALHQNDNSVKAVSQIDSSVLFELPLE